MSSAPGLGKDFFLLCCITFLTLCNTAIFHDFLPYLLSIGLSVEQAGFIIGLYPLTSMFMYAVFSGKINHRKARIFMMAGLCITALCQVSYHFTTALPLLALIRVGSGIGLFLTMASSMNLLVSAIPPGKTGTAFSLFSVAMLFPYSVMPAFSEIIRSFIPGTTILYMLVSITLLPAFAMVAYGFSSSSPAKKGDSSSVDKVGSYGKSERMRNLLRIPVLSILLLNGLYFFIFSSMFYLLRGYGISLGVERPGYFFTIQMSIMVGLRLTAVGVFDSCSKELLTIFAFLATGLGYLVLGNAASQEVFFASSILFGLGMGLCIPPLNALMYLHGEPDFRGYNANMMLLTMHFGSFCGPFAGAVLSSAGGFGLYCLGAGFLVVLAVMVLLLLKLKFPLPVNS